MTNLMYKNPKKKSQGYTLRRVNLKLEDTLEISVGGRPKK